MRESKCLASMILRWTDFKAYLSLDMSTPSVYLDMLIKNLIAMVQTQASGKFLILNVQMIQMKLRTKLTFNC
jgi:hypothetical protein